MSDRTDRPARELPLRRVITGYRDGRAETVLDDRGPHLRQPDTGVVSTSIWNSLACPADNDAPFEDMGRHQIGFDLPAGASRFVVLDIQPGAEGFMHRTKTLDYVIVVKGPVDMDFPDGSRITFSTGDFAVQRGTDHAWVNRYAEIARIAFVMLDADKYRS